MGILTSQTDFFDKLEVNGIMLGLGQFDGVTYSWEHPALPNGTIDASGTITLTDTGV